jgi:hypothetical protein
MKPDTLITEARARIIWGDSPSSVREFLISNGMSGAEADIRIKEFNVERNTEIRRIGFRNILIGAPLLAVSGVAAYLIFSRIAGGYAIAKCFGFVVIGVMFGLWKLIVGIIYLVCPQTEHKSIPDLPDGNEDID